MTNTGGNTIKQKENILILSVSQIKQIFTRMLIAEPLPSDYSKPDSKKITKRSSQKSATISPPTLSQMPFLSPPPPPTSQRSTNSSSSLLSSSSLQETRRIYKPHPKFRPIPSEYCQDSYVDQQYRPLPPPPPRPYECKKCSKSFLHSYDILSHRCHF